MYLGENNNKESQYKNFNLLEFIFFLTKKNKNLVLFHDIAYKYSKEIEYSMHNETYTMDYHDFISFLKIEVPQIN